VRRAVQLPAQTVGQRQAPRPLPLVLRVSREVVADCAPRRPARDACVAPCRARSGRSLRISR
jgi:hypothetical protein